MKIDINTINTEQFDVDAHELNGEVVFLVQPKTIGVKFTQATKIFRSSVWNMDGELISAGFPKFTNFGENPENFPTPYSLIGCTCVEKIDGSLLIVSKYKGNLILRTRGTVDASKLDNGNELELFKSKFLKSLNHDTPDTWNVSLLFEWTTPTNRIVVNYGDTPEWYVVGIINHADYSLHSQSALDMWAKNKGFKRPATHTFTSIADLLAFVKVWLGKEGVVIYSNNDQMLHKVKSDDYLVKHRLKDEFCNFERVLDFYIANDCPDFHTFQNKIAEVVDWETANEVVGDVSRCVDAWKEVQAILSGMSKFVHDKVLPLGNPKDKVARGKMAQVVLSSYGQTNRASFVFDMLDGRRPNADGLKKLFYQVLKA